PARCWASTAASPPCGRGPEPPQSAEDRSHVILPCRRVSGCGGTSPPAHEAGTKGGSDMSKRVVAVGLTLVALCAPGARAALSPCSTALRKAREKELE